MAIKFQYFMDIDYIACHSVYTDAIICNLAIDKYSLLYKRFTSIPIRMSHTSRRWENIVLILTATTKWVT